MKFLTELLPQKLSSIRMLLVVLVGVFFGTGIIIVSSFAVFMLPMLKSFCMNRTEISVVITIFSWSGAITSPFIGRLIDRYGVRKVLVPNMCLFGAAIIALAFTGSSKWQLYFHFLLAGLATPGLAGFAKLLSLWYHQRRGIILATLSVGLALSGAVIPNIVQMVISSYNWQAAYISIGLLVLLIALPAAAFMSEPATIICEKSSEPVLKKGASLLSALRNGAFWRITCGLGIVTMSIQGIQTHLIAILDSRGIIANDLGLFLFPAIAVGTLLGQLTAGSLLDRFDSPRIVLPLTLTSMVGLLLFQSSNNTLSLIISCTLLAFGTFGEIGTAPYLFTRYFGLSSFATIYAINYSISVAFFGISPVISGVIYDLTGTYNFAILFYFILLIISLLLIFFMKPYEYDKGGNCLNEYLLPSSEPSI
jgi:MFS family permease